jgi:hypothetical protein
MARVPLTRNSTGQFARVAQLVAGSNVTISESLTGEVLTVTVAASGGGGGGGGTPASSVVSETTFGQSPAVGTSTDYARGDHTHGTPAVPAHSALSSLGWTSSGHTGSTTSVAAFNGGGAAQAVQATADETMLVRRGGTLQWVAIVAALSLMNDPEMVEDFILDQITTSSAEVAPGVIS